MTPKFQPGDRVIIVREDSPMMSDNREIRIGDTVEFYKYGVFCTGLVERIQEPCAKTHFCDMVIKVLNHRVEKSIATEVYGSDDWAKDGCALEIRSDWVYRVLNRKMDII